MGKRLVLASASPRRAELLKQVGVHPDIITSDVLEDISKEMPVGELVQALALKKAQAVADSVQEGLIIGADTVVAKENRLLGKPADFQEAVEMISSLSGSAHSVLTGVAVVGQPEGRTVTGFEETKVFFKKLSKEEIISYVKTGECMDKAGAYGIQGRGSLLVERIEGDYFNVVGLPLQLLNRMLGKWNINLLLK